MIVFLLFCFDITVGAEEEKEKRPFSRIVASLPPTDDNSTTTVDTDTLLALITVIAYSIDDVIGEMNESINTINDNFDSTKFWFIVMALTVSMLFIVTWITLICCVVEQNRHIDNLSRTPRYRSLETIPLRSQPSPSAPPSGYQSTE